MITGNKDTDILLLQCLKDKDLSSIMRVNTYFYNLTAGKIFWINRTRRYGLKNLRGKKDYKYIKRIYPFKVWLTKENFTKGIYDYFQRIHNYGGHMKDCEGCPCCLFADHEVGLRFLTYCKDNNIAFTNHFNMKYIQYAQIFKFKDKFFKYKNEEIEKILNY